MSDVSPLDLSQRVGQRLRALREAQTLTLDALAQRSGVSRSNISLIERGQSSPTAVVLDRLASALGVTVAALFEDEAQAQAVSPLNKADAQPQWTDPASGYRRKNLSPPGQPLQLVEVNFPAGQTVAYETALRQVDVHQQVWMLEGVMEVCCGEQRWRLEAGDCLAMQLDRPTSFHNPTRKTARYLVALCQPPNSSLRRSQP